MCSFVKQVLDVEKQSAYSQSRKTFEISNLTDEEALKQH